MVAVTHDDEWASVVNELTRRILSKFSIDDLSDGVCLKARTHTPVSGMGMSFKTPCPLVSAPRPCPSSAPPSQPKLPINFNTFVEQYLPSTPHAVPNSPTTPSSSSSHSTTSADIPIPRCHRLGHPHTRHSLDGRRRGRGRGRGRQRLDGESTLSSDSEDAFREDEVFTRRAPCVFADGAGTYDCVAGPDLGFEFAPEEILSPVSMSL
ncbi:hypothetical protein FB451DRAFT_1233935 [Mycena latifolia]|nr:hypothetical protein FB451DRAFT_1233935 [Mycena latifolia]